MTGVHSTGNPNSYVFEHRRSAVEKAAAFRRLNATALDLVALAFSASDGCNVDDDRDRGQLRDRSMKPFPPEGDLQFLVGLEVGQVCLDPWSTQLRFSDGGQITLEGPFEHCDVQGAWHAHQSDETQDLGCGISP